MKTSVITLLVLSLASAALAAGNTVSLKIQAYDTMKYSVNRIEAHPGERVTVELQDVGSLPKEAMGHNWILLKAGADPQAYAKAASVAKAQNYEPSALAHEVIAAIPLLGPKETGTASFVAPKAPGTYPYLCSFPGHYQAGMHGLLVVH